MNTKSPEGRPGESPSTASEPMIAPELKMVRNKDGSEVNLGFRFLLPRPPLNWCFLPLLPEHSEQKEGRARSTRAIWEHLAEKCLEPLEAEDRISVAGPHEVAGKTKREWLELGDFSAEMQSSANEAANRPVENILAAYEALGRNARVGPANALVVVGMEEWTGDRRCREILRVVHRRPWPGKLVRILAKDEPLLASKTAKFWRYSWNSLLCGGPGLQHLSLPAPRPQETVRGELVETDMGGLIENLHRMVLPHLSTKAKLLVTPDGEWQWRSALSIRHGDREERTGLLTPGSPLVFDAVAGIRYEMNLSRLDPRPATSGETRFSLHILNPVYTHSQEWPPPDDDRFAMQFTFEETTLSLTL